MLLGIAEALSLTMGERDHLWVLAGMAAPSASVNREVRPSIQLMIDRLTNSAAFVTSATFDVLAWNSLAAGLLEDFSLLLRRPQLDAEGFPGSRRGAAVAVRRLAEFRLHSVYRLRAARSPYPLDENITQLISNLECSHLFQELSRTHDVASANSLRKTFAHRSLGLITVNCDVLHVSDRDQEVVVCTSEPGSASEHAYGS